MDNFQQQLQKASHLRSLFLILIVTFLVSGIGLAVFYQVQTYRRTILYYNTEAALPVHRVTKSVSQQVSGSESQNVGESENQGTQGSGRVRLQKLTSTVK